MELWKDIKGYEGIYKVSNYGRVKSVDRKVKNKGGKTYRLMSGEMKKPTKTKNGYLMVSLQVDGVKEMRLVHRLVATAFIDNTESKPEVNHIDGNKTNNNVNNLEWVTREENFEHAINTGLINTEGKKVIMDNNKEFPSVRSCAKYVGVDAHEIRRALQGKYKTVHGHTFKFG